MYEVSVEARFSAAHRLRLEGGVLEPLHGHDWHVTASFVGPSLDEFGMLVDFVHAERVLGEIAAQLHHSDLNENPAMNGLNPSAEHVALVIFECLESDTVLSPTLQRVRVTEAPGCAATYLRDTPGN